MNFNASSTPATACLSAARPVLSGYKVDVMRGERIGRVSSEWFSRPDDERFLSLSELDLPLISGEPLSLALHRPRTLWDFCSLWRALSGRSPGPEFRKLPVQRRARLIQCLLALDARQDGASHRAIAQALFGAERVSARAWKTHDLRNRTIRLVQSGRALMRGGYFDLLRYPLRRI